MKLLLLSNSTTPGCPYLQWPLALIDEFLGSVRGVTFIPYAAVGFSYDEYESKVKTALQQIGREVRSVHHAADAAAEIAKAEAIVVGGGNTFHLLHELQRLNLVEIIRDRVKKGVPYIGWSAGANVACPTIKTTNDMPIIEPASFEALHLVNFQINPHYTEKTIEGHGGESRLQRLLEYSALNRTPVVCLPEGNALKVAGNELWLIADEPVKIIRHGGTQDMVHPGMIEI